jgi:SEC-C motif-containing protein
MRLETLVTILAGLECITKNHGLRQRPYVAANDAKPTISFFITKSFSQDEKGMMATERHTRRIPNDKFRPVEHDTNWHGRTMTKIPLQKPFRVIVVALFVSLTFCWPSIEAFSNNALTNCQRHQGYAVVSGNARIPLPPLFAKKKSPKARASGSTGGFGGAATEPCVCGSGLGYNKCCGKLHQDPKAYAAATASQVVRARYSGYAKRVIDFIITSTHPENPSFEQDMEHWKKTMEEDCFDNFELTKCEILEESYSGKDTDEQATVRFLTQMTQRDTEERSAFIETSTFERDAKSGAWLYRDGVVASVDTATKGE